MIDYCTILFNKSEHALLPLHLNSLRHYSKDLFNIKISVRPEDTESIEYCKQFDVEVLQHPVYTQQLSHPGLRQAGFDCANRLDKLMQSCTSDWVFLAQLDIVWVGNAIKRIAPLMNDTCGMLGIWPHGCTVINRKVYNECHHAFWPNGGWLGRVHSEHPNMMIQIIGNKEGGSQTWWKKHSNPNSQEKLINIDGIDVGMLLPIEMQGYGYTFDRAVPYEYHHIGGASFHGLTDCLGDENIKQGIIKKINHALKKFKRFR